MRTGSALLVLLAAVSLGCRHSAEKSGTVKVDPALAVLVPADTVLLAGVRMDALRPAPAYQKLVQARPAGPLDDLSRRTGIDPRRDLWEALLAWKGSYKPLVLARGKFAETGAEPDLPGTQRTRYKGYNLIGNEEGAVVFLNATTAAVGTPAALKSLLDQRDGSLRGRARALLEMAEALPKADQIWAVSEGGLQGLVPPSGGNMASQLPQLFQTVERATLEIAFTDRVNADLKTRSRTEQDAHSLAGALRALIGFGRLGTPNNQPERLRLFDSIQVSEQQNQVHLEARIPPDLVNALAAMIR